MTKWILIAIFHLFALSAWTQRSYFGVFPEFALNYNAFNYWKFTSKIESQHVLFSDDQEVTKRWGYRHERTDLQVFASRKMTARTSFAAGYQYRINDGSGNTHRAIQQWAGLSYLRHYRLGHRIRADQTFLDDQIDWRLRYRISSDIALQGQKLDPGELYILLSEEMIGELSEGTINLENRLVAGLGRYFMNKQKLEISVDYRLDPIIHSPQRNRIWVKLSFYYTI
ncbi:MAG: DUF2490 domain-containing protein [Bacteroidota bacterium]